MAAAQGSPIPVDTFLVELRRFADSVLVVSDTVDADSVGVSADADSVVLDVLVPLESDAEQFYLYLAVIGEGTVWLEVRGVVTATVGEPTATPELVPTFVGPGSDATNVIISLSDTTITGGDSVLVTGTVFRDQAVIDGAPVKFASSDETIVASPRQVGRNQAWLIAPAALTDSVTVIATAITAGDPLTDSGTLRFFARPNAIVLLSGNNQNMDPGAAAANALEVQVLDAAGDPFGRGYQVVFRVTAGPSGTVVVPETTVTNAVGIAQTTLTAGDAAGVIQVSAEAQGLTGSPVLFAASVADLTGPASIAVVNGDGQSATVATAVTVAPSAIVTDLLGAPVPGVEVVFAVASGGGTASGTVDTTDAGGVATVGSWTLGQSAGTNSLTATVSGLQPLTFTATGTPDAPATLTLISGDNQTADGGTTLPAPLVVEAQDRYGNPVPNTTVVWSVSHGSASPTSGPTDATGRAQTSWTLGTAAQTQTSTATVSGLTPVVFTATATFQNPTILLNLVGANRIPVGGTADLAVTLSSAAPVGGVTVTITADNAGIVSVQSPGTVFIAEGATSSVLGLDGASAGTTTVRANATGYVEGTLSVEVSPLVLSLPTTLNVPFGGTASIPVQISTPAPVGGEVVSLVSSDPGLVSVLTPTVTIPEGLQTANGTVSGVLPGTATVTGTSVTYGSAQSSVSTTANLNIVQASATINANFGTDIQIRLESAGSPIAAPAGGISVTLTAADPTCVAAVSPVLIPAGLVDVTTAVTYGGSATLSCSTTLTASAPDIAPDNVNVTVNPAPGITVGARTVLVLGRWAAAFRHLRRCLLVHRITVAWTW
jgi:adhesin/invasin